MNLTHLLSLACLVVAIALAVAGPPGLAGVLFAAGTVIGLDGAALTGEQRHDTGHDARGIVRVTAACRRRPIRVARC